MSCRVGSCRVVSCRVVLCCVALCVVSCRVVKRDAGSIARSRLKGQLSAVGRLRGTSPHVDGSRVNNEEVDIYDVILSHLLDEGYAETPEAAEAIMVNMSEEWRQSIVG